MLLLLEMGLVMSVMKEVVDEGGILLDRVVVGH